MRRLVTHREQAEMLSPWLRVAEQCPPGDPTCSAQVAPPNQTTPQGGKTDVNTERGLGPVTPSPYGDPRSYAAPASSSSPPSSAPSSSSPTPSSSANNYGLPAGTNVSAGGQGFPQWVYDLGKQYGLTPSTYPGHQETSRPDIGAAPNPNNLNRGIDWTGSPQNMNNFAQHLIDTGQAEMVIHQDPGTGKTYGYPNYVDYSGNYGEEQGMVHTRFSQPPSTKRADVNTPAPQTVTGPATTPTGQKINPASVPTWGVGGIHNPYNTGSGIVNFPASTSGPSSPSSTPSSTTPSSSVPYNPSSGVEQWRSVAEEGLRRNNLPVTPQNVNSVLYQIQTESSGNPNARNDYDINAINGVPSQGLLQTIPPTFNQYRLPGDPNNITDPQANVDAAINYHKNKYGPTLSQPGGQGIGSGHGY